MSARVSWWRRLLIGNGHPILRAESPVALLHEYASLMGGQAQPLRGGALRVRLPGEGERLITSASDLATDIAGIARSADEATRLVAVSLPARHDPIAVVRRASAGDAATLRLAGKPGALRVLSRGPRIFAMVTSQIIATDHAAAFSDEVASAVDATSGERVPLPGLAGCLPLPVDADLLAQVTPAIETAEGLARASAEAAAAFLTARARAALAQALRASEDAPPDQSGVVGLAATRAAALQDLYRVTVACETTRIAVVKAPVAEVRVALTPETSLTLAVDLARGSVILPPCMACGDTMQVAEVCAQGHLLCQRCAEVDCALCAGVAPPKSAAGAGQAGDGLSVAQLALLPSPIWAACVPWLLGVAGWSVRMQSDGAFTGTDPEGLAVTVLAPAPLLGRPNGTLAKELALAKAPTGRLVVLAPLASGPVAGLETLDDSWVAGALSQAGGQPAGSSAQDERGVAARAKAAAAARKAMLATLDATAAALGTARASGNLVGHGALNEAGGKLDAALRTLDQMSAIWQGVQSEWVAAFRARPNASGALVIMGEAGTFANLKERVEHLAGIIREVATELARLPANGEKGYAPWRAAVIEALAAHIQAMRAGIAQVDPAQWKDFTAARPDTLANEAEALRRAAAHAAARAARAQASVSAAGGLIAG